MAAPSMRCVVITYSNAESMDKWATAINTTMGKWSRAERTEFASATVPDGRRDILARMTHSGHIQAGALRGFSRRTCFHSKCSLLLVVALLPPQQGLLQTDRRHRNVITLSGCGAQPKGWVRV
jgi:hypothetical protein